MSHERIDKRRSTFYRAESLSLVQSDHMTFKRLIFSGVLSFIAALTSCKDDGAPATTSDQEVITRVSLIFSPVNGGDPVVVGASNPDGGNNLKAEGVIELDTNTSYQLFVNLENDITGEDIGEEIEEEGAGHMFFFQFSENLFAYPTGDGNIDQPAPLTVEYLDEDMNGLPVGLITAWVTGDEKSGTFRVMLKHQPAIKSGTSTASDGATDMDVTWDVLID